jgi:hypothetical protein
MGVELKFDKHTWEDFGDALDLPGVYAFYYKPKIKLKRLMSLTDDLNPNILELFEKFLTQHKKPELAVDIRSSFFQSWKQTIKESSSEQWKQILGNKVYIDVSDEYSTNIHPDDNRTPSDNVSFLDDRDLSEALLRIFEDLSNDFCAPIYIGSSEDINRRLAQHKDKLGALYEDYEDNKKETLIGLLDENNIGFAGRAMLNEMNPSQIIANVITFDSLDKSEAKLKQLKYMAEFIEWILNKCHTPILGKR